VAVAYQTKVIPVHLELFQQVLLVEVEVQGRVEVGHLEATEDCLILLELQRITVVVLVVEQDLVIQAPMA
jgi:hypothetical protein